MRRRAVTIGVCVCLAAVVAVALAQLPDGGVPRPSGAPGLSSAPSGAPDLPRPVLKSEEPATDVPGAEVRRPRGGRSPKMAELAPRGSSARQDPAVPPVPAGTPVIVQRGNATVVQRDAEVAREQIPWSTFSNRPVVGPANELLHRWKAAANESDRGKIERQLRDLLKEELQARFGVHETEIKHLEAKVKQLRDQLELRRGKQDEIVDFRLQQLLREAQGLGWGTDQRAILYQTRQTLDATASEAYKKLVPKPEKVMTLSPQTGLRPQERSEYPDTPKR
jgi:hypothetical protein